MNLPLRPPAVLARSVASLDLLSGGRVELALGAGGFWDAIEAARRRADGGESVEALEEAIAVIRALWDTQTREVVRVEGCTAVGAKRGPAPADACRSGWVRTVRGCCASSAGWPTGGCRAWAISAAAIGCPRWRSSTRVRRQPDANRRRCAGCSTSGPARRTGTLADLALADGVSAFILASDDPAQIERYGREVAPQVRALVAVGRAGVP